MPGLELNNFKNASRITLNPNNCYMLQLIQMEAHI